MLREGGLDMETPGSAEDATLRLTNPAPQLELPPERENVYALRPRHVITTRPRVLSAPVLDRPLWLYSFFSPCFCLRVANGRAFSVTDTEMSNMDAGSTRTRQSVDHAPEPRSHSTFGNCLWRFFCLRCSIAEQTWALFQEEKSRDRVPNRFLFECFYGSNGHMPRTFWTMCLMDLLTGGCPCGYFYHGLGTTLYGWRLRYLVRCRYRVQGAVFRDFFEVLCCPLCAVDQQGLEMAAHGLRERLPARHIMI